MTVLVQTCHRASLYVGVFLLVAGFVSPGFYIEKSHDYDGVPSEYTYNNVWYRVNCWGSDCKTLRNSFELDSGVSVIVMWSIMATLAVLMGIVAVLVDVWQRRSTRAFQRQQKLELVQFIILLLTSFQALMVCFVYGTSSISAKQLMRDVKFPPSTVAFGLGGVLLLINVVERYILHNTRMSINEQTELDSNYRQFENSNY